MRGRPPKSVHDLKVHGQFRSDRHGDRLNEPTVVGRPEMPDWLAEDAVWLWELVVNEYADSGPIARLDTAALAAACDLWSLYRKASEKAERQPLEKDYRIAVTSYYAAWERAAAKLGLNPVDRRRLRVESENKSSGIRARTRGA